MTRFGDYETTRSLAPRGFCTVYQARKGSGADSAAVKVMQVPSFARVSNAAEAAARFLDSARLQQAMAASPRWGKIHDMGEFDGGAFYVTDYFKHSAERLIASRARLNESILHGLFVQVVDGLVDFQKVHGRAHANLKPSNVLIGDAPVGTLGTVALADPRPGATLSDRFSSRGDADDLGRLLYGLVMGREFDNSMPWPIESTPEWRQLGRRGRDWRALLNYLLDPKLPEGFKAEDLRSRLADLRPRKGMAGKLAVLACVAAAVPVGVHFYHLKRPQVRPIVQTQPATQPATQRVEAVVEQHPVVSGLEGLMAANHAAFKVDLSAAIELAGGGDRSVVMTVTAERDCFVMLLVRDSAGKVSLLIPNDLLPEMVRLEAGRPARLPPASADFSFPVTPPYGLTILKVIAMTRLPAELEKRGGSEGLRWTALEGMDLSKLAPGEWSTAEAQLRVPAPGQSQ